MAYRGRMATRFRGLRYLECVGCQRWCSRPVLLATDCQLDSRSSDLFSRIGLSSMWLGTLVNLWAGSCRHQIIERTNAKMKDIAQLPPNEGWDVRALLNHIVAGNF